MISKIQYIENFYDDQIKKELNSWTLINYKNSNIFTEANNNPPGTSLTTRWTNEKISFPPAAYHLQQKIIESLNLKNYKLRYDSGIINTVNYPGCEVWEHIDNATITDHMIYHCNIVTKKPIGGETVIEDVPYDLKENDLLCYAVSELRHKVNLVKGDSLRVMWTFGFHIPKIEFDLRLN